jgi:hypothetical protein
LEYQKAEETFICSFPYTSPANPAQQLGVENGAHNYARFLNKILAKVLHASPRLSTSAQKHSSAFVAAKCIHVLAHTHTETGRCWLDARARKQVVRTRINCLLRRKLAIVLLGCIPCQESQTNVIAMLISRNKGLCIMLICANNGADSSH